MGTGHMRSDSDSRAPHTYDAWVSIHPKRLLIADDEHLVAEGLAVNLRELGYEVIGPASDGIKAIDLCKKEEPDMALLDIRMPKKNGLAAAKTIFHSLGIPVIIISAYSDPDYVEDGNDAGVFGYLLKPITQEQLRVTIAVAWSRYLDSLDLSDEIDDLKERLEHRKTIERAKWILVKLRNIDEAEAMYLLQKVARNHRRQLVEVALSVIKHEDLLDEE